MKNAYRQSVETRPSLGMGWLGGMLLLVMVLAGAVSGQSPRLSAAGGWQDLWVVVPEPDSQFTILHRQAQDAPGHYWEVVTLPGELVPQGVTAGDDRLWLIYTNLMVQSMQVVPDPYLPQSRYNQVEFQKQLPDGVRVRSLAASGEVLWALVDVTQAQTLAQLDAPVTTQPAEDPEAMAAVDPAATQPAVLPVTTKPAGDPLPEPVARLVRLERGRWSSFELPADWRQAQPTWLVFTTPGQSVPWVIAQTDEDTLATYRHAGQGWQARTYRVAKAQERSFLSIQQQLVMATRSQKQEQLRVTLSLLRPEKSEAIVMGQMELAQADDSAWAVAADGLYATLVARQGQDDLLASSMDLQGQIVGEPGPVNIEQPPVFVQDPGQMLLVGVVAMSIFLMFVIWRREPAQSEITLPEGVVLADFGRRIAAGMIDLVPCLFVALLVTGDSLSDLQRYWPGRSGSWSAMLPGLIAIGLFVLHTGLSELFTGRTLGKRLLGLRVVSMDGQPPNLWQVLARNLLKSFDLVACYILPILALVGRHRQRLGDLVGRTVVVMPSHDPPKPEDMSDDLD